MYIENTNFQKTSTLQNQKSFFIFSNFPRTLSIILLITNWSISLSSSLVWCFPPCVTHFVSSKMLSRTTLGNVRTIPWRQIEFYFDLTSQSLMFCILDQNKYYFGDYYYRWTSWVFININECKLKHWSQHRKHDRHREHRFTIFLKTI